MDAIRAILLVFRHSINELLPFTDPSTPLYQDIAHTLILCTILFIAPRILERRHEARLAKERNAERQRQQRQQQQQQQEVPHESTAAPTDAPAEHALGAAAPDTEARFYDDGDDRREQGAAFDTGIERPEDGAAAPPPPPPFAPDDNDDDDGAADAPDGAPANAGPSRPARTVGAKKAKSLARKDQRRAYHEFLRSQGEQQRAADAASAAERAAGEERERRRRAAVEAEVEERRRAEREGKKELERRERERERRAREAVVGTVRREVERRGFVECEEVASRVGRREDVFVDGDGVEKLVRLSGVATGEKREGAVTMVTGRGWVVRVTEQDMREVYRRAVEGMAGVNGRGKIGYEELGAILEGVLKENAAG